jgi:hypothetical protein
MVLAPACLVDLGDVGAAAGVAANTGEDTADAPITPTAPISTSRRDAEEFDAFELVDMSFLNERVRGWRNSHKLGEASARPSPHSLAAQPFANSAGAAMDRG